MSSDGVLSKLHVEIKAARVGYRIPSSLVSVLGEEYAGCVRNADGRNFYHQWLALAVRSR